MSISLRQLSPSNSAYQGAVIATLFTLLIVVLHMITADIARLMTMATPYRGQQQIAISAANYLRLLSAEAARTNSQLNMPAERSADDDN